MSTTDAPDGTITEPCEACGRDTPHTVSIEIREEGEGDNAPYSREPYRVAKCRVCRKTNAERMNNA